jgi:mRNA interferase HigB
VRIIAKKTLVEFFEKNPHHADAKEPLLAWHDEAKRAVWKNPANLKAQFGTASILGNNRVVFNIHGNKYRLVVRINYQFDIVYIRFIGTHKEYDKIDVREV